MNKELFAAPYTPFDKTGEFDPSVIPLYAEHLVENGVKGVFVNGTSGESLSLTVEERKQAAETWVEEAGEKLTVLIHVGSDCIKTTCSLAFHASEIGADGVGCMPPVFFKPGNVEELIPWLTEVGNSAGSLPLYYYHIPCRTGVNISIRELFEKAEGKIPNLAGAKFTYENLMDLQQCIVYKDGQYKVFFGRDEMLLSGLAAGVTSGIGSTYNMAAPLYYGIIEAFENGEMETARRLQENSQAFIQIMIKYGGGVRAGKAIMKMIGIDCGPVRLPLLPFTDEEFKGFKTDLEQIGFFDWALTGPAAAVK